jgi:hypothetical protein
LRIDAQRRMKPTAEPVPLRRVISPQRPDAFAIDPDQAGICRPARRLTRQMDAQPGLRYAKSWLIAAYSVPLQM